MKITAIIEQNDNGFYVITTDGNIAGCHFGGCGYSEEEAKIDFMESIHESFEVAKELGREVLISPSDIEIDFKMAES